MKLANSKLKTLKKRYIVFGLVIFFILLVDIFVNRIDKIYYQLRWTNGVHFNSANSNVRLAPGFSIIDRNDEGSSYVIYWRDMPSILLYLKFFDGDIWNFERGKEIGALIATGSEDGCYSYETNLQGIVNYMVYLEEFAAFVSPSDSAFMEHWQDLCFILEWEQEPLR